MSAEEATATPQEQAGGPPVSAATSVAEIPAPNPSEKQEEGNGEQAKQAPSQPAGVPTGPGPAPPLNGRPEEVAAEVPSASHEEAKPVSADKPAEPAEPAALEVKETNGSAAKPADAVSETPTAEPGPAKGAPRNDESAAITPVPATNGRSETDEDAKMKEAPSLAPAPVASKRKAEDAFGAEADGDVKKGGEKKAKAAAEEGTGELAEAATADAVAGPVAETNGASTAPPPAKKGGRQKKQAWAPAPVGRTERKTRSQGPAGV